jgi:hypothetical protein
VKFEIGAKEKDAIEQVLNKRGATEAVVKVERGEIVVLQVEKKKIV